MNKLITLGLIIGLTGCSLLMPKEVAAENIDITGTVQSRCTVNTDTPGVYGNPNAYTLTTRACKCRAKTYCSYRHNTS